MTNSPNKLFEFSAGGLPCVATPTLSNRKWVQESNGAVLADGYTAEDLYEALKRVLSNKNDWDSMSNNLRRWSNLEGNWKKSEQTLLELYDQALS
jgi:glycosyltransferase involved in cell wall biosynthesis